VEIRTARLVLRPFRAGDEDDLVEQADDRAVWLHLRDRFPHPYTHEDAEQWIAHAATRVPASELAVTLGGRLIGGVGCAPGGDVHRFTAEIGYWLGSAWWGRGYGTEVLAAFADYAFATFPLERLEAWVFAPNLSSRRVLEKCGFRHEGTARRAVFKDSLFLDAHLFGRLRDE
jgi:ribosomal-protein-alanine N-acetyltransferase